MTGAGILINEVVFYLERSLGFTDDVFAALPLVERALQAKAFWGTAATVLFAIVVLLVTVPASRASDRAGRKPIVWIACLLGAIGMALATFAPGPVMWLAGVVFLAAASGSFVAVDWAYMTDIIPKISAGRYMGLSNVATASATAAAPALGGLLITATSLGLAGVVGDATAEAAGPRVAYAASIILFAIAAMLLRPVRDPAAERIAALRRAPGTPTAASAV
jgi:MFS family permease